MPRGGSIRKALAAALAVAILISPLLTAPTTAAERKELSKPSTKEGDYDFRRTRWGMSRAQVRAAEGEQGVEGGKGNLYFTTTMMGYDFALIYIFADDRLVMARYLLYDRSTRGRGRLEVFSELLYALHKKYGEPTRERVRGEMFITSSNLSQIAHDVATGLVGFHYTWVLAETEITLLTDGADMTVRVALEYTSRKLAKLLGRQAEKEVQD